MKGHCTGAPFSTEEVCGPVKRSTVRLHAPSAERSAESMVPVTVTEVAVDSTTPDWLTRVSTHMVSLVVGVRVDSLMTATPIAQSQRGYQPTALACGEVVATRCHPLGEQTVFIL